MFARSREYLTGQVSVALRRTLRAALAAIFLAPDRAGCMRQFLASPAIPAAASPTSTRCCRGCTAGSATAFVERARCHPASPVRRQFAARRDKLLPAVIG